MPYSERAYFDGDHCHHVAAWVEHQRLKRKRKIDARVRRDLKAGRLYRSSMTYERQIRG